MISLLPHIGRRLFSIMKAVFDTIGTHNGVFHCDEVLGCAMLKILRPGAQIIRTRDEDKLAKCDIVIDVGSIYDLEKLRFDHHQRDFNHTMSTLIPNKKWTIKLSSAGLVYCHYGKDILRALVKNINESDLEKLFDRMYESFIQEIDAIDNGIPICEGQANYTINTNLSARVKRLNKRWNQDDFNEEKAFSDAMNMVSKEFEGQVSYYVKDWLPARDIVLQAINNRFKIHLSGSIIHLSQNCPWKGHFFDLEKELNLPPTIKFVLFDGGQGMWRVQAVSLDEDSFLLRVPLLESWRGLREDKLFQVSGIEGIKFVHSSGFIGGNSSMQGALEMAVRTIAETKN
ncbi:MYG1 exonuclease [Rhodnius prolixus]|uniref:Putative metal-binding protein n=1 Tax=Rhodnius prolixus TaxID=13249 RepID=R4G836_RHOPR